MVSNRPCGIGSILLYIFNIKKIKLDYSGEYSTNEIIKYFIVHLNQSVKVRTYKNIVMVLQMKLAYKEK